MATDKENIWAAINDLVRSCGGNPLGPGVVTPEKTQVDKTIDVLTRKLSRSEHRRSRDQHLANLRND
jgi:hypothetical protein